VKNSKLKTQNSKLIALVVVFVVLASLYSLVIPLGEGPDEPGHAHYVFFLARAGRLPDQRSNEVPGEGHQPPLAYALMAPLVAWLPIEQRQFDLPANPRFTWASGAVPAGQARELNAVAHGSREYWPWSGAVLAWHLARLVSVALGAATAVFTFLAARELNYKLQIANSSQWPGQSQITIYNLQLSIPLLAAALVAFNPQFLFVSALITNDALLTALSAALLWLAVRGDGRGAIGDRSWLNWRAVALGAILGLALITKQSAILLLPVAVLGGVSHTGPFLPWLRRSATSVCCMLAVALAICGWWYLRNLRLYGDPFGLAVFQAEFITQAFDPRSLAAWGGAIAQLHSSFWARFGWVNVPAPGWAILFYTAIEAVGLVGLVRLAVASVRTLERLNVRTFAWWPILALPVLALGWVLSFALTAGLVAWQGRLLFPALPAIGILLAVGLCSWAGGSRQSAVGSFARTIYWLLPTGYCLLALWLPFGAIRPAYPFHTLPENVALARIGTPVYGRLGLVGDPGAELRGWRLEGETRPGSALQLTLMWHALGRQNRSWTVFIHLVDTNEQILAQDNTQPQAGAFPMKQWVAGDWVEDRHTLTLPANLAPGVYTLRIGLYDPRTDRRAAVFDQKSKLIGDLVEVGQVRVQ
jgi:hypothetical protein